MNKPRVSVVITTYEWPRALDVLLRAFREQPGDRPIEVVVADDGARAGDGRGRRSLAVERCVPGRARLAAEARVAEVPYPDLGALAAQGDYLLFLDGDSIPRAGLFRALRRCMLPGWFMASKRLHLSRDLSRRVLDEGVPVWRWSTARWLLGAPREVFTSDREIGGLGVLVPVRDRRRPWRPRQPEFSPPFEAYGFCLGIWRDDFERVNGFDLRYENWGGEDEDIAARLRRAGLRCGWPGTAATILHLWHPEKRGTMKTNKPLVRETQASDHVEAIRGLRELAAEPREDQVSAKRVGSSSPSDELSNR